MQKMLLALAAVAAFTACSDPARDLCIKSQECSGKTNEDAVKECDKDADKEEDTENKCQAEADASTACLNENGTCDEVGVGDAAIKIFGAKASGPDGKCETEAKAVADCNTPAT